MLPVTKFRMDSASPKTSLPKEVFSSKGPTHRILFNRVPKCSSSTAIKVFQTLSKQNPFVFVHSENYTDQELIADGGPKAFVKDLCQMKEEGSWLYEKHFYFVNFRSFGCPQPVYINIYREPGERRVSGYYFHDYHKKYNMTYEECWERKLSGCRDVGTPLSYFCGMDEVCKTISRETVNKAKRNIDKHYAVVGVSEELDVFYQLLEYYFPVTMKNAVEVYRSTTRENVGRYEPVSDKLIVKLKSFFRYEYELYDFIMQRLYTQKLQTGIV